MAHYNQQIRHASKLGITAVIGLAEHNTETWLRHKIFDRNSVVFRNIVFSSDVYEHYVELF